MWSHLLEDFTSGLSKLSDIRGTESKADGENSSLARLMSFAEIYLFLETCKKPK